MSTALRPWLAGLLAGLFALAVLAVPAQHARMVLERAALELAYAMPDGTLPVLCTGADGQDDPHGNHAVSPDCLACVLMAAPGLAPSPPAEVRRIEVPVVADLAVAAAPTRLGLASARHRARAPPVRSIL